MQFNVISNQNGGSAMDTLLKLVMVFFISLSAFSVGTYVGKSFSDAEYRRAQLEGEGGVRTPAHAASHGDTEHDEHLDDSEVESLAHELIAENSHDTAGSAGEHHTAGSAGEHNTHDDEHIAPHPTGAEAHPTQHDGAAPAGYRQYKKHNSDAAHDQHNSKAHAAQVQQPAVDAATNRLAHGKAPTPHMPEARKPASHLPQQPPTALGKYTVQVAAYPTEMEAEKFAESLRQKGLAAFYLTVDIKGRKWYRVSVGSFGDIQTASSFQKDLLKRSEITSAFVQKVVQ